MTLLDIHPAIMARNLLFFMMIEILVQDTLGADDRLELQATMVYVFIGWIMPSYCEKRSEDINCRPHVCVNDFPGSWE